MMTAKRRVTTWIAGMVAVLAAAGCEGGLRFKFMRYPETPVVMAAPSGLSSSELAAIIVAIR